MCFEFKRKDMTAIAVDGWPTVSNSIFESEEHPIALFSPCVIYTIPWFFMGKMQKLPSPIK